MNLYPKLKFIIKEIIHIELSEQYDIAPSTLRQWVMRYNNRLSFNAEVNRLEKELIELKKSISAMGKLLQVSPSLVYLSSK